MESAVATLSTGIVGIGDKIGHTDTDLVSKSVRPDGLLLKPSRPLVTPDFLIWEMSPREASGTTEYETWSEVAGQRFGIIMCYNPGKPEQNLRLHYLENYQFQLDENADYIATLVSYKNNQPVRNRTIMSRKWTKKQPLHNNEFNEVTAGNGTLVVRINFDKASTNI